MKYTMFLLVGLFLGVLLMVVGSDHKTQAEAPPPPPKKLLPMDACEPYRDQRMQYTPSGCIGYFVTNPGVYE